MTSLINKARKPKFEVHLIIYDLNNIPLVTGVSQVKWRIPGSLHAEHHGRTPKCPIVNHRVEYNYGVMVPVRIGIDKQSNLMECPMEFEVVQEFGSSTNSTSALPGVVVGSGVEKTTLGVVKINLSEYVEESEALLRNASRRTSYTAPVLDRPLTSTTTNSSNHTRKRSSLSVGASTVGGDSFLSKSTASSLGTSLEAEKIVDAHDANPARPFAPDIEEGVIRRHLMQQSKVNSTLKVGILMIQVDGDKNYSAPPLKTAPVFGGIAGVIPGVTGEPVEPGATDIRPGEAIGPGQAADPSIAGKSRDVYEVQDMYRRSLAASWASQPGELPADECIEDIFSGGDGFRTGPKTSSPSHPKPSSGSAPTSTSAIPPSTSSGEKSSRFPRFSKSSPDGHSASNSGEEANDLVGTLRPRDLARFKQHLHHAASHFHRSSEERPSRDHERLTAFPAFKDPVSDHSYNPAHSQSLQSHQQRATSKDDGGRNRSDSLASLAPTLGSSSDSRQQRGRDGAGFKKAREVEEFEVRDDLVAWTMPAVS
ncbi:hypothetical protein DL546_007133 [Coniochaeta pulveracea]|uniref:C2 NT-type domain-containing protein n=1 Tax=Coniochaeta pulveracea TaxID=177199 RepID=A0A420Y8X8_9PEZI|nr:hypothetical protein DL546_007133 [Coniochaeta pulveracea]